MSESDSLPNEQRRYTRFPCVGIELFYSPLNNVFLPDVADALLRATSHDLSLAGMAFDIEQNLPVGQLLLVSVKSPEGENEMLKTEVRWCRPLQQGQYRVGVAIIGLEQQSETTRPVYDIEAINNDHGAPSRARFICPACQQLSWFVLVGIQGGTPQPSIMPLYNCSACHTTRSIPSLLGFNRALATEE